MRKSLFEAPQIGTNWVPGDCYNERATEGTLLMNVAKWERYADGNRILIFLAVGGIFGTIQAWTSRGALTPTC